MGVLPPPPPKHTPPTPQVAGPPLQRCDVEDVPVREAAGGGRDGGAAVEGGDAADGGEAAGRGSGPRRPCVTLPPTSAVAMALGSLREVPAGAEGFFDRSRRICWPGLDLMEGG